MPISARIARLTIVLLFGVAVVGCNSGNNDHSGSDNAVAPGAPAASSGGQGHGSNGQSEGSSGGVTSNGDGQGGSSDSGAEDGDSGGGNGGPKAPGSPLHVPPWGRDGLPINDEGVDTDGDGAVDAPSLWPELVGRFEAECGGTLSGCVTLEREFTDPHGNPCGYVRMHPAEKEPFYRGATVVVIGGAPCPPTSNPEGETTSGGETSPAGGATTSGQSNSDGGSTEPPDGGESLSSSPS
jgi:hypothetical protein